MFLAKSGNTLGVVQMTEGVIELNDIDFQRDQAPTMEQMQDMTIDEVKFMCSRLGFRFKRINQNGRDAFFNHVIDDWEEMLDYALDDDNYMRLMRENPSKAKMVFFANSNGEVLWSSIASGQVMEYDNLENRLWQPLQMQDVMKMSMSHMRNVGCFLLEDTWENVRELYGLSKHCKKQPLARALIQHWQDHYDLADTDQSEAEDGTEGDAVEVSDDEQQGEMSVLDFLAEDYLKDAGCFSDDIDNGIQVFFKEFKDDRTLLSINVPSSDLHVNDIKELFYDKVVEYAKSDLPWNVSNFQLRCGGNIMDEEKTLGDYMTKDEIDSGKVYAIVELKLKGGGKSAVKKEGKKEKMVRKAQEYFQTLNEMSQSIPADVFQIAEVQCIQERLNTFIQKVHTSGGHPALIDLIQNFLKQKPEEYDEVMHYLKTSKTGVVEVKLRNVALKMLQAQKLEDMTDALETMTDGVKTAVVMGFDQAVATSSRFGLTEFVNLMELVKNMSITDAVPSVAHMG